MIKTTIKKELDWLVKKAESMGFSVLGTGPNTCTVKKEGWATFELTGHKWQGCELIIPNQNLKDGQGIEDFTQLLIKYISGSHYDPVEDGSELQAHLIECKRIGYEIVKVGEDEFFVKPPNMLAMQHLFERKGKGPGIDVLNQLV